MLRGDVCCNARLFEIVLSLIARFERFGVEYLGFGTKDMQYLVYLTTPLLIQAT